MLTGYNPGYAGKKFMQPFATATGITEESLEGFPWGYHDIAPAGGDIFGTPEGRATWQSLDKLQEENE